MVDKYIKNVGITVNAMIVVEDDLYISDRYSGGLFRYNLKRDGLVYCGDLSEDIDSSKEALFNKILNYEEKLYFIPYNAHSICIFDTKTEEINHVPLCSTIRERKCKFVSASIAENKLYMCGYEVPLFLILDLEKNQFENSSKIDECFRDIFDECKEWKFYDQVYSNEHIYAVMVDKNKILDIDLRREVCNSIELGDEFTGYVSIVKNDDWLVLCPYGRGKFVKYDISTRNKVFYANDNDAGEWSYVSSVIINDVFYALPCWANDATCINLKNDESGTIEKLSCFWDKRYPVTALARYNSFLIFNRQDLNEIVSYDVESGEVRQLRLWVEHYPLHLLGARLKREGIFCDLKNYVEYLLLREE